MRTILNNEEFEDLVKQGIDLIPEHILQKLENVDICIENKVYEKSGSLVLGLYQGVPKTKRWKYGQVLPDKITIFKKSIEKNTSDPKEKEELIKNVVWHEIAHHFGFDEKDAQRLGKKKG